MANSRVRVTVVLEVQFADAWQTGCTLEQVMNDARRKASAVVGNLVQSVGNVRMVGEPKVNAAISDEG